MYAYICMHICMHLRNHLIGYIHMTIFNQIATYFQSNDSHIIYSVNIKYDLLVPGNLLTRLHIFKIPAYCLFPRLLDASVPFRPVTQTAPPVIGGANFDVDMFIYQVMF